MEICRKKSLGFSFKMRLVLSNKVDQKDRLSHLIFATDEIIKLAGPHTNTNQWCNVVQDFGGQPSGSMHPGEIGGFVDANSICRDTARVAFSVQCDLLIRTHTI